MKRIGLDSRFYDEAGPGRYVNNIVKHLEQVDLENEYIVFLRPRGFDAYKPQNPNFKKVLADYKWYTWSEQIPFLFLLLKFNLDLFYVPHFNIPVLYPKKIVTAIPDIIMHSFSTEAGTTLPKPYFRFKKFVYKMVVWWAVFRSKKVIVPSQDVLNDFKKVYPQISTDKYVLAYEGVDPNYLDTDLTSEEVLKQIGVEKPFLLYVSSAYEHKNLPRLVDAFEILINKYDYQGKLLLVGKRDKFSEKIATLVKSKHLESKILLPGLDSYINDKMVVALRRAAQLYVFPSLKEGFSLTPLEAQVQGLPCVISDIPVHREIYDDSVVYFDPLNVEDIAEKINLAITDTDLQKSLIENGYAQVKKFSWMETAKITFSVFQKFI